MGAPLWAAKITLKSGKSWLYAHGIGFTRIEAKDNYLKSGRVETDERYGSKVTFAKVDVHERGSVSPSSEWWALVMGAAAALEDAAHCLRDPDAKRAAEGAAAHYRTEARALLPNG